MKLHSVLITGANRGIGYQFVVDLLKQNPKHIIATCRDLENAKKLNELASKHSNLHILQLDMTDYSRYDSFVEEVSEIVGENGLTLLIQNAGLAIDDLKVESYLKMYEVNAVSPLVLTRKLLHLVKKSADKGERTIVAFISSLLASIEMNTFGMVEGYRMSKSALNQGVRTLAFDNRDEPIEFVLLHPGHVQTDMGTSNGKRHAPVTVEESIKGMLTHLENQKLTKDGRMVTYDGQLLPW